jgi:hypothetical protein
VPISSPAAASISSNVVNVRMDDSSPCSACGALLS